MAARRSQDPGARSLRVSLFSDLPCLIPLLTRPALAAICPPVWLARDRTEKMALFGTFWHFFRGAEQPIFKLGNDLWLSREKVVPFFCLVLARAEEEHLAASE